MLPQQNKNLQKVLSFTYPKLYFGKESYIGFNAFDPASGKMKRKKIKLNHIEKITERRKYATGLIMRIIEQLESGWNPWMNDQESKSYTLWKDVSDKYERYINRQLHDGSLKESTVYDYLWRKKDLEKYMSVNCPITYAYQFDRKLITDFLDYVYMEKRCNARSRNNYLLWISSFCSWLIEKSYLQANPVEGISRMKVTAKKRDGIPPEELKKLCSYLELKNKHYLLACMLLYYSMIRPKEMLLLRIGHIDMKNKSIYIPAEISKNGKDGKVAINDELITLMNELHIGICPPSYYLFGPGFIPGSKKGNSHQFRDYWTYNIRPSLNFPKEFQFYSLKDSGIRDLANAEGIVFARDQARHSDISTTNIYIKNSLQVHEEVKEFKGNLRLSEKKYPRK